MVRHFIFIFTRQSVNPDVLIAGAVADVLLEPYLAIVLGLVGGVASTLGFIFLPDWVTFSLRSLIISHVS